MNCRSWKIEISALLDGNLSDELKGEVERHLADCADCAEFHNELAAIDRRLQQALVEIPLPSSIWNNLESTIKAGQKSRSRDHRFSWDFKRLFTLPRWGYGVAGVAAVALTVFLSFQTRGPSQEQILSDLDMFTVEIENNPFLSEEFQPENPFFSYSRFDNSNPFGGEEISR